MAEEKRTSSAEADKAMTRYANGDDAAFAVVYDCVGPRIYSFLLRKTGGDAARSEDLTQQTFLQIHRARGRYIEGASVMSWACAIAHRLAIDDMRRNSRRAQHAASSPDVPDSSTPSPQQVMEAQQTQRVIADQLETLPKRQQDAFELVKWQGMTHSEAAEVLGVTIPAIKALTHRAYQALRSVLNTGGES